MPISVEWIVTDRVILSTLSEKVTESEIKAWIESIDNMIVMGVPPVHHIAETSQLEKLRLDTGQVQKLVRSILRDHNSGWHIEITDNANNAITTTPDNASMRIMTTLESALQFLRENDETLRENSSQKVQP